MTKLSSANELGVDYPIADQSMAGMNVDPVLLTRPVRMSIEDARDVAKATYGVSAAQVRNLGSERDQTLLLQDSTGAALAVMKVSNPAEDPATLDMEALGARHAARADPTLRIALPRPAPGSDPAAGPTAYRAATRHNGVTQWVRMYDVELGRGRTEPPR